MYSRLIVITRKAKKNAINRDLLVSPHNSNSSKKYLSHKAQDLWEYQSLSYFHVTKWSLPLLAKLLGGPFSFDNFQSSLWVTSWLTLQYLATLARENLCVPTMSIQAERIYSWMGWLLKKKALSVRRICQHATILE